MYNQNRIFKVLKAIALLKTAPPKSVKLLAKQLEITDRTLYRYLDLIKELGFEIKKDASSRVYIPGKQQQDYSLFTKEEALFLKNVVLQLGNTHILKDSVLRKLDLDAEIETVGNQLMNVHLGTIIAQLNEAITSKKQVVLKKYFSIHSNTVSDRRVEPFQFTDNYQYICAFEPETQQNKFFSVERIKEVKCTADAFQFEGQHVFEAVDIFGFSSTGKSFAVDVSLNLRAFVLLKEEYPSCVPHIRQDPKTLQYKLQATVNNLKPITRFIRGLPNDVTVNGSTALLHYLNEQ